MKLSEVKRLLGLAPVDFEWLDDARCIFSANGTKYGVLVQYLHLDVGTGISVANITFGVVEGEFRGEDDLLQNLTGRNSFQRTVFSTVTEACLANPQLMGCDVLVLGSSDAFKDHRDLLYTMAASELAQRGAIPDRKLWKASTPNGTKLVLLSRVELSQEERMEVLDKLHLSKEDA